MGAAGNSDREKCRVHWSMPAPRALRALRRTASARPAYPNRAFVRTARARIWTAATCAVARQVGVDRTVKPPRHEQRALNLPYLAERPCCARITVRVLLTCAIGGPMNYPQVASHRKGYCQSHTEADRYAGQRIQPLFHAPPLLVAWPSQGITE